MKKRAALAGLGLLVLSLLLSGCFAGTVRIDEGDAGTVQSLRIGDRLLIQLAGNPTTGYAWIRTGPTDLTDGILIPIDEGTCTVPDQCSAVGIGGDFLFEYTAASAGTVTLSYVYQRPWEDDPIDEFSVIVWVRE
jgi:predicted secreted protein